MNAFIKTVASLTLAGSLAVTAQAQSTRVDVSDLNLASTQDQKVLALRIDRAARTVCAAEGLAQSPDMIRAERRCIETTKNAVQQQIAAKAGVRTAAN